MKIKLITIAISLVFILSFVANPSWADRKSRYGGKQGIYMNKNHKLGHHKWKYDTIHSGKYHFKHKYRHGVKHTYARCHRYDRYPRHSWSFFGISVYDPWWGFSFQTHGRW